MLHISLRFLGFLAVLGYASSCFALDFSGVHEMVRRQIPSLSNHIIFKLLPSESKETFELSTKEDNVVVRANSLPAASVAVNYYLNQVCHQSISHCGDNRQPIERVVPIAKPIRISTPFHYRYSLNYCTYNYSYAFYRWKDFERELDWMALHGVNLMLAPLGMEKVWQETLRAFDLGDNDIARFIPGPGYTAWWLMGNLEGWGGPMSQQMIDDRYKLQIKILRRMRQLGIEPVVQGFPGIVPSFLHDKYPKACVVSQGKWNGFQRPSILLPQGQLFYRMAKVYYDNMKKYYGADLRYFGGDLFHEGGNAKGVDLSSTASKVQKCMLSHFPDAKWVLQGWNDNPSPALLAGLDKKHVLLINLAGEIDASWKQSDEFGQTPWIWGSVNHFGGKTDMGGQLPVLVEQPHRALAASQHGRLKGLGILPEGIHTNPVVYDLALQTAWSDTIPSVDHLLRQYIWYRYGTWNDDLYRAWQLLANSVYGEFEVKGEGTYESVFCARPSLHVTSVSTWGPKKMQYQPEKLLQALVLFRKAAVHFKGSETYEYDLVDLARQVMANNARNVYNQVVHAYNEKDSLALNRYSSTFLHLIDLQDSLLSTNKFFLLGKWLQAARQYGENEQDQRQALVNARTLISYWGPDDATTRLHDYANKEWAGLLKQYYAPRWRAFFAMLAGQLRGEEPQTPDFFSMERTWAMNGGDEVMQPKGDYLLMVDSVIAAVTVNQ